MTVMPSQASTATCSCHEFATLTSTFRRSRGTSGFHEVTIPGVRWNVDRLTAALAAQTAGGAEKRRSGAPSLAEPPTAAYGNAIAPIHLICRPGLPS